jgi:hypothetical protein
MITAQFRPTLGAWSQGRADRLIGHTANAQLHIIENRGADTQNHFGTACLRQSHALAKPSSGVFISSTECGAKYKTYIGCRIFN